MNLMTKEYEEYINRKAKELADIISERIETIEPNELENTIRYSMEDVYRHARHQSFMENKVLK